MLNGALTIGTLDGANIEILEAVGEENIFIFGQTAAEVEAALARDDDPWQVCHGQPALRDAVEMIRAGFFSSGDRFVFESLLDSVFQQRDRYMVFGDFADYVSTQESVARSYLDHSTWIRKSIVNVARAGRFSSDQTVLRYAQDIWRIDVNGTS